MMRKKDLTMAWLLTSPMGFAGNGRTRYSTIRISVQEVLRPWTCGR